MSSQLVTVLLYVSKHVCKGWWFFFRSDFFTLDEWLSYNYASSCRRTGISKVVTFPASAVLHAGKFRLVYFGRENCVLGRSDHVEDELCSLMSCNKYYDL